jgi:hypothetical protein
MTGRTKIVTVTMRVDADAVIDNTAKRMMMTVTMIVRKTATGAGVTGGMTMKRPTTDGRLGSRTVTIIELIESASESVLRKHSWRFGYLLSLCLWMFWVYST